MQITKTCKLVAKTVVALFLVGVVQSARADQNLQVVARNFNTKLNCQLRDIDVGYNSEVLVKYTVCDYRQVNEFLEKAKKQFDVVLKVEGLDEYSTFVLQYYKIEGDYLGRNFNVKVIGILN